MGSPSSQASPPAPLLGATTGGPATDGAKPVIPRRVPYYQAAFDKETTIKEVTMFASEFPAGMLSQSLLSGDGSNVSDAPYKSRGSSNSQLFR